MRWLMPARGKAAMVAAVVTSLVLSFAGSASGDSGAKNATELDARARALRQIEVDLAARIKPLGEAAAAREAITKLKALKPRLAADLPTDATPPASAARAALIGAGDLYLRQYDIAVRRTRESLAGRVVDVCRIDDGVELASSLGRALRDFDDAAGELSRESGVPVYHASGDYVAPRWRADEKRALVVGLCVFVTGAVFNIQENEAAKSGNVPKEVAAAKTARVALAKALAYLAKHQTQKESPYAAGFRALLAYASATQVVVNAVSERLSTGRVTHQAEARRALAALPSLRVTSQRVLTAEGAFPPVE